MMSPETVGFSTERLKLIDAAFQAEIDAGHYAGVSLTVARHGKPVKSQSYGFQSLETRAPLREDAIFRIASMTKPVVGVAMMILYEEGKWQLDDPITRFIPEFADLRVMEGDELVPLRGPITMRDLMRTTAGFATGSGAGAYNPKVDAMYAAARLWDSTLDDMISKLAKLPLEAQPGTCFRYGLQQEIQGEIIKRITGQGLDSFMESRIFQPLDMRDTGFDVAPNKLERLPPTYVIDGNLELRLAENQSSFPCLIGVAAGEKPKFLLAVGGLYSTARDFMRFAQMLANGGELDGARILSPLSVALMTGNLLPDGVPLRLLTPIEGVGYGMGVGVLLDPARAQYHGGTIGKGSYYWGGLYGTWFWVDPTYDVVVVGMVQQLGASAPFGGVAYPVPELRSLSRTLIYQALVDPAL
ncbi:hypothetical protein ASE00_00225 [Sphingomonas sp. Root710]|uniref:serine hydrolase domain-containing protein n=1 Tax=Sphingomonas sp. Root710 TaxID=1736594 RepID=UPI0006F1D202|nr:serine hydrolase domain-containing protein [Sphingomonas sp. Root710]KRB85277.1 hypothetical protein ASE00_00225 [Sphingomonas sp. Root710]